jgi:hypothetical protein
MQTCCTPGRHSTVHELSQHTKFDFHFPMVSPIQSNTTERRSRVPHDCEFGGNLETRNANAYHAESIHDVYKASDTDCLSRRWKKSKLDEIYYGIMRNTGKWQSQENIYFTFLYIIEKNIVATPQTTVLVASSCNTRLSIKIFVVWAHSVFMYSVRFTKQTATGHYTAFTDWSF